MIFDNASREHLFDNPSELQKIFIKRRSFRKYMKKPVEKEKILNIKKSCEIFIEKRNFRHSTIHISEGADEFNRIVDSATKGFSGKVNPWLKKTNADTLMLAMADMTDVITESERLKIIAETSILMQIAILRATELGLATCWMAGVNLSEIEKFIDIKKGVEVIAISTLGYPPESSGLTDYDFWANRLLSSKRKPLAAFILNEE